VARRQQGNQKRVLVAIALIFVVLVLLIRSCSTADRTALGPKQEDYDAPEWVGLVESVEIDYGGRPVIDIDFGRNRARSITLDHVKVVDCESNKVDAEGAALGRLSALLPSGTAVRLVRSAIGSQGDFTALIPVISTQLQARKAEAPRVLSQRRQQLGLLQPVARKSRPNRLLLPTKLQPLLADLSTSCCSTRDT
jgi:hypothetical protein